MKVELGKFKLSRRNLELQRLNPDLLLHIQRQFNAYHDPLQPFLSVNVHSVSKNP